MVQRLRSSLLSRMVRFACIALSKAVGANRPKVFLPLEKGGLRKVMRVAPKVGRRMSRMHQPLTARLCNTTQLICRARNLFPHCRQCGYGAFTRTRPCRRDYARYPVSYTHLTL